MQIANVSTGRVGFFRVADKNLSTAGVNDFRVSVQLRPVGVYTAIFTATQTQHFVFAQVDGGNNGEWVEFDNFSVREVLGNQATQPTTASKPVIAALPNGKRAMKFDGSNDLLNLGPGAVLSNASNHWVCAAFILDTLPGTGQLLSIYSSSNTGNDAVLAPYLYLRDDRLLVATWRDQALVEATVTAGSGNITPGLPYVAYAYKSGTTHGLRLNGVVRGEITRSLGGGTTNTANIGMIVRSATTNPFNGKLIAASGQSTLSDTDRSTIERYLAQQIGAQYLG
ncbi:MAG: hypothetical protein Q7J58_17655 [Hydrogenophaga sp.]|uniref:hypothetical protein n=1 Tax=Hydrogenophaga sp. TaxID=1904254 RepID=UPI00271FB63B|nr:hypothetical protein [Hydrogenophaga sp.]MDO9571179.1 hypothetical protein [Hydrogenophaga sp.]